MEKFGIGIVGCGNISATHAEAITQTSRGRLIAAYSRTNSNLKAFRKKYDIGGSTSYTEFLSTPGLDMVSICTPSGTHLEYGKQAAEAGKHVVVEKPIEVSLKRGRALIEACRANGVRLAVIYQNRFIKDVVRMKQLMEDNTLGKTVQASASVKWFRSQEYYGDSVWRGTFALDGGGAVINQSIHTIDLLQWLAGDIASLFAYTGTLTHTGIEAEDNAVACLKFKNGAIGLFEASTSIIPSQERSVEINGKKGTALLKGDKLFVKKKKGKERGEQTGSAAGADSPLAGMTSELHRKQFESILESISNQTETVVSGEESLKSLAIVEAIYTSAQNGTEVSIDEILKKSK